MTDREMVERWIKDTELVCSDYVGDATLVEARDMVQAMLDLASEPESVDFGEEIEFRLAEVLLDGGVRK